MPISRTLILGALIFFGAVAMFMGLSVTISALVNGSITYSFGSGADLVTRTATRTGEPDVYWTRLAVLGLMPVALGAAGVWWARHMLRR